MEDDKALAEINKIAHRLWVEDGRPDGQDRRHWEAAKEIWAFQQAGDDADEALTPAGRSAADPEGTSTRRSRNA